MNTSNRKARGEEIGRPRLSLVEAYNLIDYDDSRDNGLLSEWDLLDHYFERPWILSESATVRAKLICEGVLDGLKSAVRWMGGKVVDFGKFVSKAGKKLSKGAVDVLKRIGGNIAEVFTYIIKQMPGGEIVLDFLKNVMGSLKEKIKEMSEAIKDKVEEWAKTAKKFIIDFFLNTIWPNEPSVRADIYKELGITEEQVEKATNEMRELGVNTITELNWALSVKGLLSEDVSKVAAAKGAAEDVEDTLKVVGFLENPPDGEDGNVDPTEFMRGKAAGVVDKMFDIFAGMAEKNFLKYMQPLFDSKFFSPFASGFGLASAAFMGILASGKMSWDTMVTYITSIVNGFKVGTGKAGKAGRAVRRLFTADGAGLLRDLVKGLVEGSNIEVIIRALSGDPKQIAEAAKRLIGTIMGGLRAAVKKFTGPMVGEIVGGDTADDTQEEVEGVLGDYLEGFFEEATA
tara:strand:+ start:2381 stop:3754 length:1374 start_codon:yes stop_codon:yes gene_type:complete